MKFTVIHECISCLLMGNLFDQRFVLGILRRNRVFGLRSARVISMTELKLVKDDPWLEPYAEAITRRRDFFLSLPKPHSHLHQHFGLFQVEDGWLWREYAPRAQAVSLVGDFNQWDEKAHQARREKDGAWSLHLPSDCGLKHLSSYKIRVTGENGIHDRLSPFTTYAVQDEKNKDFASKVWAPGKSYQWQHSAPEKPSAPRIYEAHIGMATEREGVGTYDEFRTDILPRIAKLGYDTIQLMAVAEHPYYGSFGYHVANFFAPSSRFGTPDDLKALIDEAHRLGIVVLLDLVHSHTVKNFAEGIREFDGEAGFLLHSGPQAEHPDWDSLLFDYGHPVTRDFLLSNLRYWLEEFRFDGFRFDGVTSMLYHHHGNTAFDHYDKYFVHDVDQSAVAYLQLANQLVREINPEALTVAEDFSGMPGLCQEAKEGGLGFDYRLGMGVPDFWIKLLKHTPDEEWNLEKIWHELSNRRYGEKTVAYAESHDQALVGDKTLAFWLMDKEMYWHMNQASQSPEIDRGIALHKIIRLLTMVAGGEAWLNFMGNEFGHPEWVDFPREGNGWSHKHARRQWSLADHPDLKYEGLQNFEQAILELARDHQLLEAAPAKLLNLDQKNLCFQFERANLLFAVNLHPTESIEDYAFPVHQKGDFVHLLDSDQESFSGHGRLTTGSVHPSIKKKVSLYLPCRSIVVLGPRE